MINWIRKRWFWILGFVILLWLFPAWEAEAASADVTIFTRAEDIHVGDTFYVMISVVSEMPISDVELTIPIDSKKLKFTTGGDVAAATKSKVTITDIGSDTAEFTKIYALGFEAKKKGDFVFHIESPFAVYAYDAASDTQLQLSVSSNELPVTILKTGTAAVSPKPSDGPDGSAPPKESETPDTTDLPDSSDGPETSGIPGESAEPGTSAVPEFSGQLEIPAVPEPSDMPEESVSPSPASSGAGVHGGSIWTNILIGVIVMVIIGLLLVAGYFIVKLLH